jgi:hypothetical protein
MLKIKSVIFTVAILLFVTGLVNWSFSATLQVKPDDYPALTEKEIGHLRWIVKLAQQLPGDWSYMGGQEPGQEWLESYRYQLAFMAYALSITQYHKTPAYRELYQKAMDQLIQKMVRKDVWEFWVESSRGGKKLNPALKEKGQGWVDPVMDKNIMYSGHLIQMVELYQMLYRDRKYDKTGSIVFSREWLKEEVNRFEYDSNKIADVIHKQFEQNPLHAIECEVNLIFAQCNQHPVLGLMLYDYNHKTNLANVRELLKKTIQEKKFLNPETHNFMNFYLVQQDKVIPASSPGADGWTGAFMHAWDPKLIEENYPYQVKQHVKWEPDGTASALDKTWSSVGAPFFAILAKEVGDEKTAKGILAWMDKNYAPVWTDGMFRYPRNDEKKVTPFVTNLAALAELNLKDGIWSLHNRPWRDEYFAQPFITGIDYPKVIVKQAYYDSSKDALIVSLVPGAKTAINTSFIVNQLDTTKVYSIKKNGKLLGNLKKGVLQPEKGIKGLEGKGEGSLEILTDLSRVYTFVIQAEK